MAPADQRDVHVAHMAYLRRGRRLVAASVERALGHSREATLPRRGYRPVMRLHIGCGS